MQRDKLYLLVLLDLALLEHGEHIGGSTLTLLLPPLGLLGCLWDELTVKCTVEPATANTVVLANC